MGIFSAYAACLFAIGILAAPGMAYSADKIWEHTIHSGRDPFSPPKTKISCVKMAKFFGAKTCVGWKMQCKHIRSRISIWIKGPNTPKIKRKAEECGKLALTAGALSSLVALKLAGKEAAWKTFIETTGGAFKLCVKKMGSGFFIGYDSRSRRDKKWGSC